MTIDSASSPIFSHLHLHFAHGGSVPWPLQPQLSNLLNDAAGYPVIIGVGELKNVIIWSLFHKLDLMLFSLAKYKCENYNLLWY